MKIFTTKVNFAKTQFNRMLGTTIMAAAITFIANIADTVLAGHLFDSTSLAGVNLIAPIISLVTFVSALVAYGAAICRSVAAGRFDRAQMDACCSTGLWAAVVGGLSLAAMFPFVGCYLSALGVYGETRGIAISYCSGYWAVAAIAPVFLLVNGLVCGDGGHRHARLALIANIVVKFGLAVPFSRWFGVAGLAWSTFAGNLLATVILFSFLRNKACTLNFRGRFSLRTFVAGVRYSVLDQFNMLGETLKMIVVNRFVVSHFGESYLPVVAAFSTVSMLVQFAAATSNALQPVMGVYFGEENYRRVREVAAYGAKFSFFVGLGASAVLLAFPTVITGFIGLNDPELMAPACLAIRIAASFLAFTELCFFFDSYFLYANCFGLSVCMISLDSCLMPIGLGLMLGGLFSASGLWLGLAMASSCVLMAVFAFVYWRSGNPYMLPAERDAKTFVFDLVLSEAAISEVSAKVMRVLQQEGQYVGKAVRAPLITEEALMVIKDRNQGRRVLAEVTLDLNDGVGLTLRDDGEIFDITDSDADIGSLRSYLVASVMSEQRSKFNLITTGINRNGFRFA